MKKLIIVMSVLFAFSMESCSDWLDLRPESETVLEDYWQTESQATAELAGCYRGLIKDDCMARMMVWGELRSDNIVPGKSISYDMYNVINQNITPTNGFADWGSFYSVINYCNTFLHFAPSVVQRDQNFTITKLHTMEAEALTIRALCYFYLVRTFRDVPLITTPSISDADKFNIAKSNERVVLDQIIQDLNTAQQFVKSNYGTEAFDKGRITLSAVNALLADVYLWDQQYAKCADMCDRVLADKTLKLVAGNKMLTDVFYTGNSTESILELQFDKNIQNNNLVNGLYGYNDAHEGNWSYAFYLGPKGNYCPFNYQPATLKESVKDVRQSNFIGEATNGSGYCIYKYALYQCIEDLEGAITPIYRTSGTTVNWILYRMSDVMLMKAEALVQLDRSDDDLNEAMKLVNTTYLRSNVAADSLKLNNYPDKGAMQELVLRERQRELVFEGKRWFDLMRVARRNNDATAIMKYISPKLTGDNLQIKKMTVMDALYMPILQSQIEINHNLVQNPFYNEDNVTTTN
jgi:starch-binding outer membrane protein, SusD/RagB family